MIIDTHSHIYQNDFKQDIDEVVARAKQCGVSRILLPNIDSESIDDLHLLVDKYPDYCIPMMGLHPTSVKEDWENELNIIKKRLNIHSYVAIGEIGIDLYWDKTFRNEQICAFEEQLKWSIEYNLPVAIHSRDANRECIDSINRIGADKLRGVFHSFGGSFEDLAEILSLNTFLIGINGVVTFKNSGLSTTLKSTDLNHIIIETDAPYLSPVPYRGKRNEPSYTVEIVSKLAEIYDTTVEQVESITTQNAIKLFGLKMK